MPTYKLTLITWFFSIKNPTHPWHSKSLKPSRNPETPFFFWKTFNVINVGSNVTAFSFIFVEYIKNVYGWSDSAPPGGIQGWNFCPPNFRGEIKLRGDKGGGVFYKTKNVKQKSLEVDVKRTGGEKQNWIQIFFGKCSSPDTWGFMIQIMTYHIFQMGWFNHQLGPEMVLDPERSRRVLTISSTIPPGWSTKDSHF